MNPFEIFPSDIRVYNGGSEIGLAKNFHWKEDLPHESEYPTVGYIDFYVVDRIDEEAEKNNRFVNISLSCENEHTNILSTTFIDVVFKKRENILDMDTANQYIRYHFEAKRAIYGSLK